MTKNTIRALLTSAHRDINRLHLKTIGGPTAAAPSEDGNDAKPLPIDKSMVLSTAISQLSINASCPGIIEGHIARSPHDRGQNTTQSPLPGDDNVIASLVNPAPARDRRTLIGDHRALPNAENMIPSGRDEPRMEIVEGLAALSARNSE